MSDTPDVPDEALPDPDADLSRPLTYGVEAYTSRDYARAERDRLWRRVWLQAGRLEDIPEIGDYLTCDIGDDSILVVRAPGDEIRAYHNVCAHRGRRLVDTPPGSRNARGRATGRHLVCGYHGWRYDLEGRNTHVPYREDWQGALEDDCIGLRAVCVDSWGGWVWINMDPGCEPLREYLEPAASLLEPFELQNMRPRWRRWLVFDCNWKVAMEAFYETYHVADTHPEFMRFGDYRGWGRAQGKHGNIGYDAPRGMEEDKGRLRIGAGEDARISTAEMQTYIWDHVNTNTTRTMVDAALRLVDELPEGTPREKVLQHWLESARRDDEARGVIWPTVDPEHVGKSGTAWQIFPNLQIGHAVNNALCYSARPCGADPDRCIFDAAMYELYPDGKAPETEWEHIPADDPRWGSVLPQDFSNMAAVQRGMKSLGFDGPKPGPYAERSVANFHRNLARYMGRGAPRPLRRVKGER